jgi:LmbE family N-acetylglucosaminyl deacetylase
MKTNAPVLVALSPHADDACFSLASVLSSSPVRGELWTVFTESVFAPALGEPGRSTQTRVITRIREREDREFASHLGFKYRGLGFEEPALRSLRPFGGRDASIEKRLTETLGSKLNDLLAGSCTPSLLLLVPLGVGAHIDHLATRAAAVSWWRSSSSELLFYCEIPYMNCAEDVLCAISDLKRETGIEVQLSLRHRLDTAAAERKLALCRIYRSQRSLFTRQHARYPELLLAPCRD